MSNAHTIRAEILGSFAIMKNKWSSENVKRAQQWLIAQWPDLFTPGPDLKPLSLKIHKEILEYRSSHPEISRRVLQEALKRHTTSFGYLYGMTKATHRHNLKGEAVERISQENRNWAQKTLRAMQKLSQKSNRSKAMARKINRAPVRTVSKRAVMSAPAAKTTQIRYKRPKRRIVAVPQSIVTENALAS